uniref:Uncharacterized protein n=1 Tax=Anguilla anguilla TaxID=7936 RepID=A0A0E9VQK2_ANGAN
MLSPGQICSIFKHCCWDLCLESSVE